MTIIVFLNSFTSCIYSIKWILLEIVSTAQTHLLIWCYATSCLQLMWAGEAGRRSCWWLMMSDLVEGNTILPFLSRLQALKCRLWWSYMLAPPVCRFGDLLAATLRPSSGDKCHFHYQSHSMANCWKKKVYYIMHWYHYCELLCSRKRLEYHCTGPIQIPQNRRTEWGVVIVKWCRAVPPSLLTFCYEKWVWYHLPLESHILR